MLVGAIDVGSDSTRLLIANANHGRVDPMVRRTAVTHLAEGVTDTGRLRTEAVRRVIDAVEQFVPLMNSAGCDVQVATFTAAVRLAENGPSLSRRLESEFGLRPRILTAQEEAHLSFLGASIGRPRDRSLLVVDLGGLTTELATGHPPLVTWSASTAFGVVRLGDRWHRETTDAEHDATRRDVRRGIAAALADRSADDVVALANTTSWLDPLSLALGRPASVSVRPVLHVEELEAAIPRLTDQLRLRAGIPGVEARRAQTLVAGALVLSSVLRVAGKKKLDLSDRELLDGVALDCASGFVMGDRIGRGDS